MIQVVPGSFTPTDAYALETFERLVLSQKPAETPWTSVTDYSFEARREAEGKHPELIRDVFQPQKVYDVGCGAGHLIWLLREAGVRHVYGVDANRANERSGLVVWGDVTAEPDDWGHYRDYDLVICREVLEHLTVRQIRRAVGNLCQTSSRFVYVTTRFAHNPTHLLSVDTADDLDPTHISMLNQTFLRVLFVLEGFKRRADLEARLDWKQLGRVLVYERA